MIGGIRIIGTNNIKIWINAYVNGLRLCLSTKGDLDKLKDIFKCSHKLLCEELSKKRESDESTGISAFHSAIYDVIQDYEAARVLLGCDAFAWKLVTKKILDAIEDLDR